MNSTPFLSRTCAKKWGFSMLMKCPCQMAVSLKKEYWKCEIMDKVTLKLLARLMYLIC